MSFAADMLTASQTAYQAALAARVVQFQSGSGSSRRVEQHDIDRLLKQVQYWEARVADEQATAAGQGLRRPFQIVL
jgi:uncharacterized membrane protein